MRRLEIDWSRAEEIFRRAENSNATVLAAGDRVRVAKRVNQTAQHNLTILEAGGVEGQQREDRNKPFLAGQAAINIARREAKEAEVALAAANSRYAYASLEDRYFGSLRQSIREHIETLPRAIVPAHLLLDV